MTDDSHNIRPLLELLGVDISILEWKHNNATILVNGVSITLGITRRFHRLFASRFADCDKLMSQAAICWAKERKELQEARARIKALETYVVQLELMPSDHTWRDLVDSVAQEEEAIKRNNEFKIVEHQE